MSPIILYQHLFLNLQLLNLLLWEIVNLNLNLLTEKKNIYIYYIERVVRLRCKDLIYTLYVGHPVERVPLNYNQVYWIIFMHNRAWCIAFEHSL